MVQILKALSSRISSSVVHVFIEGECMAVVEVLFAPAARLGLDACPGGMLLSSHKNGQHPREGNYLYQLRTLNSSGHPGGQLISGYFG